MCVEALFILYQDLAVVEKRVQVLHKRAYLYTYILRSIYLTKIPSPSIYLSILRLASGLALVSLFVLARDSVAMSGQTDRQELYAYIVCTH